MGYTVLTKIVNTNIYVPFKFNFNMFDYVYF